MPIKIVHGYKEVHNYLIFKTGIIELVQKVLSL